MNPTSIVNSTNRKLTDGVVEGDDIGNNLRPENVGTKVGNSRHVNK